MEYLVLRNQIHNRLVRTECGERQAAANRFREAHHVGPNIEKFRCSAPSQLRSGFNLIEDQQGAILVADLAQPFQESWLRQTHADIHHDRLKDDGGNLTRVLLEATFYAG